MRISRMSLSRARAAVVLVAALAVGSPAAASAGVLPGVPEPGRPVHSSDGEPGTVVGQPLRSDRAAAPRTTDEVTYPVAPGLTFRQWTQTDVRGPVRISLLVADLDEPTLRLRYAAMPTVRQRAVLTDMLGRYAAVAGVNADFFDIHDTGAPLGTGVDRGRVLHGNRSGWTMSFLVFGDTVARVRKAAVRPSIVGRPGITLTGLNSPHVPPHGIGVYTPRWGNAAGYRVVDGARKRDVRQVLVRNQRVVSNTRALTRGGPFVGRLLVGRGQGAAALKRLKVGQRVRFAWAVKGNPTLAVSGSERLLAAGEITSTDDRELHPRTAVGVDRDTGDVLLVVVDGRQVTSRGMTLVELAGLLRDLGAEEALNLDGGGSSTMVARDPEGAVDVVNSPSSGEQRRVPNGLALITTAPPD